MSRKPRLHYPGALYHVMARGNNKQDIFREKTDYHFFLNSMKYIKERKPYILYAYCLMPNHFHFLLEVNDVPLSVIMQRLLTTYVRYFNRTYNKRGHLFQNRYKAILCEKEHYLLELVRYIHLNPVRAHIVNSPAAWEWSAHNIYLGRVKDLLVDNVLVLSNFSENVGNAYEGYAEFVREGLTMGHKQALYPKEKTPYLGGKKFVEELTIKHGRPNNTLTVINRAKKQPLESILKKISVKTGLDSELIRGQSRLQSVADARKMFIIEALATRHKGADIARFLDCSASYITKVWTMLQIS